jgi:hypothetical protein
MLLCGLWLGVDSRAGRCVKRPVPDAKRDQGSSLMYAWCALAYPPGGLAGINNILRICILWCALVPRMA